ncbi:hypothetical protein G6F35_018779 [Rhizopus arrhizus]|nr:hypothetical protein G6F31_021227 [Rhizopus arrhizus]KAG1165430.1 hypothetical protein G6F35_018779 [Rhizopus arrhizus]KAG1332053.1 hypothetical protein G6F61_015045 [Rhizopus arrhizus]KAG1373382.1 hypothetical protein G6F60_015560 [Rhizopus arrhizus]
MLRNHVAPRQRRGLQGGLPHRRHPDVRHAKPVRQALHAGRDPRPYRVGAARPVCTRHARCRRAGGLTRTRKAP